MATQQREQIRCEKCRRLLFVALGAFLLEIKCKCGAVQVRRKLDATNTEVRAHEARAQIREF
jgi:phage FluMu protein Com